MFLNYLKVAGTCPILRPVLYTP